MMSSLLISLSIAALDQLIKLFIRRMPIGVVLCRIPFIADITHCINTGAAFSMLSGNTLLLAAVSVVLLCFITYAVIVRMRLTKGAQTAYAVLLGGGIGNLVDRLFMGGVTDYIRLTFIRFPVFNLADIAISLSACTLILLTLIGRLEISTGE